MKKRMIVPIGLFFMVVLTSGAPAQEEEEIIFANTVDDSLPTRKMDIKMPNSHPQYAESYLCTAMKLDSSKENYIVGFEPNATSKTAHHMLLYGCKTPGQKAAVFNCGAMAVRNSGLPSSGHPCGSGNAVIYAWAQDAPALTLPEGVGFRVGGDSGIDWLVLQVHYAVVNHIPPTGDVSGVSLRYTNVKQPRSAGVLFLGTNGRIPSKATTKMEAACQIYEDKVVHPFAFRVHTHRLGRVVSGWRVKDRQEWELIGKENPQMPQMFYPVSNNSMVIRKGETVAARCTMRNYRDHAVWVGPTRDDEMCNFYMMYYVEGKDILQQKACNSIGPPIYSWGGWRWLFGGGLYNIPDDEASKLDD